MSNPENESQALVISRKVFSLLQRKVIRVIQYLRLTAALAGSHCSGGKMRALAGNSGPVTVPRMVQGAIRTSGLFLMRLYFPESLRVIT